jgi:hypothetical protein
MSLREILRTALWSALVYGFVEGLVLIITLPFPAILAPYKGSIHSLWIAPLVEIPVFVGLGIGLAIIAPLLERFHIRLTAGLVFSFFSFLGFWVILSAPKLLHPLASILLGLGMAIAVYRWAKDKELALRPPLKWVAAMSLVVVTCCYAWEPIHEWRQAELLPAADPAALNAIVVVLDTVRYDRFEELLARGNLPNLQRLAAEGIRYDNAWSTTSWSLPSQASILTGLLPEEHGADWPGFGLKPSAPTLGEFFSRRGYATAAFSSNAAWITPTYLGRGFLRFKVFQFEDLVRRTSSGRRMDGVLARLGYPAAGRGREAASLNADLDQFLDSYSNRPFFVYMCYMDVNRSFHKVRMEHPFWTADPPEGAVVEAYDQALTRLDSDFGKMLAILKSRGVLDKTVIAVTSDHGESFGEKWMMDHEPSGHGTSLYPEQTRVPLILWAPDGRLADEIPSSGALSISFLPNTIITVVGLVD